MANDCFIKYFTKVQQFVIIFMHRETKKKNKFSIPAMISYLSGTEPAMFGINLKYVYPFVAGMNGSAMAEYLPLYNGRSCDKYQRR